jgi:demethylmenaquinone methyltransferase/2-methoxy-6-polyprenyl-1,4-benzoquinol methylase
MFDDVAERYDLTNDVLSLGQTRLWRRAVAQAVAAAPGERVLDLAAGTGSSSLPFAAAGRRSWRPTSPWACSGSASARTPGSTCWPVTRCGCRSPTPLRRGHDLVRAAQRLRRRRGARRDGPGDPARRPAGGLRVQPPDLGAVPHVYTEYLMRALPSVARRVSSNPDAYVYLAESIRAWPDQAALAGRVAAGGWLRGLAQPHRRHRGPAPRTQALRWFRRRSRG